MSNDEYKPRHAGETVKSGESEYVPVHVKADDAETDG